MCINFIQRNGPRRHLPYIFLLKIFTANWLVNFAVYFPRNLYSKPPLTAFCRIKKYTPDLVPLPLEIVMLIGRLLVLRMPPASSLAGQFAHSSKGKSCLAWQGWAGWAGLGWLAWLAWAGLAGLGCAGLGWAGLAWPGWVGLAGLAG